MLNIQKTQKPVNLKKTLHYTYDATWHGLLSVIFETYGLDTPASRIESAETVQPSLFGAPVEVATDETKAERVKKGIIERIGKKGYQLCYRCFLSERDGMEMMIYRFLKLVFDSNQNHLEDYGNPIVLKLHQINKQIGREVHRMHAFVRFQETRDGLLVALVEPDFNVMPLIGQHFEKRYPALRWLIYDTRRHYGWYYENRQSRFVTLSEKAHRHLSQSLLTNEEQGYQSLWQSYFHATNIPERKNMKLHLQHVPKRYWRFLVEKW